MLIRIYDNGIQEQFFLYIESNKTILSAQLYQFVSSIILRGAKN